MISPNFATMFCFVQTDAALDEETVDLLTGVCVKRSFDRISVDGQLSTSDTVFVIANGASGVRIESESQDELRFGEALDALMRQLAYEIVADGEGARRVGRVVVRGHSEIVERVARAVADSPLVKTQLHGADPNFGRILQSTGQALAGTGVPFIVDLEIEGRQVVSGGQVVPLDERRVRRARAGGPARCRRVRADRARRGRRDRGLLLRPLARVRDDQRGVHDLRGPWCATSRHSSKLCPTSGSSTARRSSSSTAARR